jgi:hypothetical protein
VICQVPNLAAYLPPGKDTLGELRRVFNYTATMSPLSSRRTRRRVYHTSFAPQTPRSLVAVHRDRDRLRDTTCISGKVHSAVLLPGPLSLPNYLNNGRPVKLALRHSLATSLIKRVGSRTRTRRACNDQQLAQAVFRWKTPQDEDSFTIKLEYHHSADRDPF